MDWNAFSKGDFATFKEPGDTTIGTIIEIRVGQDYNKNPCPELLLENADGKRITLTAGQVRLKLALIEAAPEVGDRVKITFTGFGEAQPGRNPAKDFSVEVKKGESNQTQETAF